MKVAGQLSLAAQQRKKKFAEFKNGLFRLNSDVGVRVAAFDPKLRQQVAAVTEAVENDISKWFSSYSKTAAYDARTSLPHLLQDREIELFQLLMNHEFSRWGWPPRGWYRTMLQKLKLSPSPLSVSNQ
jgi:hypothetical protein